VRIVDFLTIRPGPRLTLLSTNIYLDGHEALLAEDGHYGGDKTQCPYETPTVKTSQHLRQIRAASGTLSLPPDLITIILYISYQSTIVQLVSAKIQKTGSGLSSSGYEYPPHLHSSFFLSPPNIGWPPVDDNPFGRQHQHQQHRRISKSGLGCFLSGVSWPWGCGP
jgi:hypothetical protein